jgi:hypothetical protein
LHPVQRLDLHRLYTLTVVGTGVRGSTGIFLDGAAMGHPGSDYVTTVDAGDLVITSPHPGAAAALRLARRFRSSQVIPMAHPGSRPASVHRHG